MQNFVVLVLALMNQLSVADRPSERKRIESLSDLSASFALGRNMAAHHCTLLSFRDNSGRELSVFLRFYHN